MIAEDGGAVNKSNNLQERRQVEYAHIKQGDRLTMQRQNGASETRPARLERSMLFVPASRPDMIEKAARSAADAVCIDLEDAVVPEEKAASRANVAHAFNTIDFGPRL